MPDPNDLPEITKINVPSCIRDAMRQPLRAIARAVNKWLPLDQLVDQSDPTLPTLPVQFLQGPSTTSEIGQIVFDIDAAQSLWIEGVLQADLLRDDVADIRLIDPETETYYTGDPVLIEVQGRYVMTGKKAPSGARCAAFYNGVKWRAKVIDVCVDDV